MSAAFAVVPVKAFDWGKTRLRQVVDDRTRAALVAELFERAMASIALSGLFANTVLVVENDEPIALAEKHGVRPIRIADPGRGLAAAVDAGILAAVALGGGPVLVLLPDLPLVGARDLERMIAGLAEVEVLIATDEIDEGTNALALRDPTGFPTCFGGGPSKDRHLAAAAAAGRSAAVLKLPGLAFDVDQPEDYRRFRGLTQTGPAPSSRAL